MEHAEGAVAEHAQQATPAPAARLVIRAARMIVIHPEHLGPLTADGAAPFLLLGEGLVFGWSEAVFSQGILSAVLLVARFAVRVQKACFSVELRLWLELATPSTPLDAVRIKTGVTLRDTPSLGVRLPGKLFYGEKPPASPASLLW